MLKFWTSKLSCDEDILFLFLIWLQFGLLFSKIEQFFPQSSGHSGPDQN